MMETIQYLLWNDMVLSGSNVDFGGRVMALKMSLFDSLESKARRARA
jgi:hypothetical protein